jgi:hypothetical protein
MIVAATVYGFDSSTVSPSGAWVISRYSVIAGHGIS